MLASTSISPVKTSRKLRSRVHRAEHRALEQDRLQRAHRMHLGIEAREGAQPRRETLDRINRAAGKNRITLRKPAKVPTSRGCPARPSTENVIASRPVAPTMMMPMIVSRAGATLDGRA